jgi:hypothetical protein
MMLTGIVLAVLAANVVALPQAAPAASQPIPETGENGKPFGIFGFELNPEEMMKGSPSANNGGTGKCSPIFPNVENIPVLSNKLIACNGTGPPSLAGGVPKGPEAPTVDIFDDGTPGSGKYPAQHVQDGPNPNYTVYAPKTPPPSDVKLPVLVYGTCGGPGTQYTNLLTEIASHGYLVIAAGPPSKGPRPAFNTTAPPPKMPAGGMSIGRSDTVTQMKRAVDWIVDGKAAKYGNIDTAKIATSGLSCGGLQVRGFKCW